MGAGLNDDEEAAYRSMYGDAPDDGHGRLATRAAASACSAARSRCNNGQSALDFLERTSMDAQVSSDKIRDIAGKVKNIATYPYSGLANNLKLVARLIAGGLPTRVFYVSQGGYDTHTNQRGSQDARLKELADAVKAFTDDLTAMGEFQRVTMMTFSEFGRRVTENGSRGTDHGAAAPMFIIGGGKLQERARRRGAEPRPRRTWRTATSSSAPTSAASTPRCCRTGSRRRPRRSSGGSSIRCR